MKRYRIPGRDDMEVENLVLDYNGTIAHGGRLIEGVEEVLNSMEDFKIYILTADTYGTVREECKNIRAEVLSFPKENAGLEKKKIVESLGGQKTICLGNGFNDYPMFQEAVLSIAVMEGEGMSSKLLQEADIIVTSILSALELVKDENKLRATLRN